MIVDQTTSDFWSRCRRRSLEASPKCHKFSASFTLGRPVREVADIAPAPRAADRLDVPMTLAPSAITICCGAEQTNSSQRSANRLRPHEVRAVQFQRGTSLLERNPCWTRRANVIRRRIGPKLSMLQPRNDTSCVPDVEMP